MKGVPIRIEIGPNDLKNKQVTIVTRDNGNKSNQAVDATLNTEIDKIFNSQ